MISLLGVVGVGRGGLFLACLLVFAYLLVMLVCFLNKQVKFGYRIKKGVATPLPKKN